MRGVTHQRVVFSLRAAMAAAVLMMPLTANAAPILTGDTVTASLFGRDVTTPFASSAVVGDGAEFTGVVNTGFKSYFDWGVTVDIGATGFTLVITAPPDFNLSSTGVLLGFTLSGLNFTPAATIAGVNLTSAVCAVPGSLGCSNGPRTPDVSFTGDSVTVQTSGLGGNQTFAWEFVTQETAPTPVPEPASLALLGTGLAACVARRRRRN